MACERRRWSNKMAEGVMYASGGWVDYLKETLSDTKVLWFIQMPCEDMLPHLAAQKRE